MKAHRSFRERVEGSSWRVRAIAAAGGVALAFSVGCADQLPLEVSVDAAAAPMTVTGANPADGAQGQTLVVRIFGTGFESDAVPAWERGGVPDTRIEVVQRVFVSSTELRATIAIAPDAEPGIRDISVSSDRKKGIGSESPAVGEDLFRVREFVPQGLGFLSEGLWSGTVSHATGINDEGVVVGASYGASDVGPGRTIATYWTAASGTLGITGNGAIAADINNRGRIIGQSDAGGFIFDGGVLTYLEHRGPYHVIPTAINDSGIIVGLANGAVVLRPLSGAGLEPNAAYGSPVLLPVAGGSDALPRGINDNGDIVGSFMRSLAPGVLEPRAVLWKARPDGTYADPLELGGGRGHATGINDAGWIVGFLSLNQQTPTEGTGMTAVLWHPDDYHHPILLKGAGGVETFASAINNQGLIAGERRDLLREPSGSSCCVAYFGVVWEVDTRGRPVSTSLISPSAGYDLLRVHAINDAGWIVGSSSGSRGGGNEATLWRPR